MKPGSPHTPGDPGDASGSATGVVFRSDPEVGDPEVGDPEVGDPSRAAQSGDPGDIRSDPEVEP